MPHITPQMKDQVLNFLRDECPLEEYIGDKNVNIEKNIGLDFKVISSVLHQFERLELLSDLAINGGHTHFILHAEAHDLAHKGGFTIQEEIFKANIEKLGFEIDALRKEAGPNHLERVNKLASIAGALLTGIGLLPK